MPTTDDDDTTVYETRIGAIQAALADFEEDEVLWVCRSREGACQLGRCCEYCAQIDWAPGLTVADVLEKLKPQ